MLLADQFASSPAGYLTGLGTPIVALLVGAMWRAWAGRLKQQDRVMGVMQASATEQNKALAILLADHNHVAIQVAADTAKTSDLDKSLAVLTSRVDDHLRWVERQQKASDGNAV